MIFFRNVPTADNNACSSVCASVRIRKIISSMLFSLRNSRYASAVITNPLGTGIPAVVISPRLAPLPPATGTSSLCICVKSAISIVFNSFIGKRAQYFRCSFYSFFLLSGSIHAAILLYTYSQFRR